jgi:hypothetical protein
VQLATVESSSRSSSKACVTARRYRRHPEANLRRAREQLAGINTRIAAGTFSFAEEFPDYVHLGKVPRSGSPRTCDDVFDNFLAHCAARVAKNDIATAP